MLSLRLGVPVQLLKRMVSSSDFLDYCVYLEEEQLERTPVMHYLALIAREVRQSYSGKKAIKLKDLYLPFELEGEQDGLPAVQGGLTSKQIWLAHLGVKEDLAPGETVRLDPDPGERRYEER